MEAGSVTAGLSAESEMGAPAGGAPDESRAVHVVEPGVTKDRGRQVRLFSRESDPAVPVVMTLPPVAELPTTLLIPTGTLDLTVSASRAVALASTPVRIVFALIPVARQMTEEEPLRHVSALSAASAAGPALTLSDATSSGAQVSVH